MIVNAFDLITPECSMLLQCLANFHHDRIDIPTLWVHFCILQVYI